MGAPARGSLPSDLERGRDRFQAWRRQRQGRGRIPGALWALAVQLANVHGVHRTAAALGLNAHSLKTRAEALTRQPQASPPALVELPAPVPVGKQGVFELDNGAGATLRVRLIGYAADVEALARGFWDAR
jgi:hypothetical protein